MASAKYPSTAGSLVAGGANRVVVTNSSGDQTTSADLTFDDSTNVLSLNASEAGGDVEVQAGNSESANGASRGVLKVRSGGASGGDPVVQWVIDGVTTYTSGIDNSDSDSWKLSMSTALGTTDALKLSSNGSEFTFGNGTDGTRTYRTIGAGGEIGTNTMLVALRNSFNIGSSVNSAVGEFIRLFYYTGSAYKAALEIDNTAAGATGVLDLMKGGGDVRVGSTSGARFQGSKGADAASGGTLTLGEGNLFDITGTTAIDYITTTRWQVGSEVTLQFDGSVTVNHNTGSVPGNTAAIFLAGAANFAATAGDMLKLVRHETGWREVSRTVI